MTFQFGPLELDEPARILRLATREVALQPRIFDLLVYLVHNRARVVPKEELLDAVWPGVLVTDNSLQRAISMLRSALREGGLEDAVRNVPKAGYRFFLDLDDAEATPAAAERQPIAPLAAARAAVAELRWLDAVAAFEAAAKEKALSGDDLDSLALALQCEGRPVDAAPVLVRAISDHASQGRDDAAALSAGVLAAIHLERGEAAVAAGWLARADDFSGPSSDSVAAGQTLWVRSRLAAAQGDPEGALALAERAYEIGRRRADVRIEALGLMYRGFYRLSLGRTRDGLADQDHAAAIALSHNLDPISGGVIYCNVIWACRTFGDWARANQWTSSYESYMARSGMALSGSCQLHRAEVLSVHGTLREALARVSEALSRLASDAPWATGDAHRILGDIHAAMGDRQAARAAYEVSYGLGWCPEPGNAMLLLEEGDVEGALACLERSLIGRSWWTLQRQGVLLAHLAVVLAHAGQHERARALVEDLAGQDDRWPMASIRALTCEASAILARSAGDTAGRLRNLHLARQLWTSIDARIDAARLRIMLAEAHLEMGDPGGAGAEMRAACMAAESLESDKLRGQCRALRQRIGA